MTAPMPGQVYAACDPRDSITVRVVAVHGGRADVVDARTGQRPRSILLGALHPSGRTGDGRERRTGYRLVQDTPAPAEAHPPCVGWLVEVREGGQWRVVSSGHTDEAEARSRLARRREEFPGWKHRLVRKTTAYTVEEA